MRLSAPCKHFLCCFVALALSAVAARTPAQSQPGAGAVAENAACPADDSGLALPTGFCATLFADAIGHARHLVVAPNGVVYVNTWSGRYYGNDTPHAGGFLVALQDTKGVGKADLIQRFGETAQNGAAGGTGIAIYKNALYAEINDKIVRYALSAGSIVPEQAAQPIVTGLPLGGDHPMHPFAIDAEGLMYIDVATATNACQAKNRTLKSPGLEPCPELETRGGIWRYDASKTNQTFSPAGRFATGIRNAEGFAVDSSGHRIFVTQHGRDQLHSNWPDIYRAEQEATLPAEELLQLTQGGDYGWPKCYYDPQQRKLLLAPEYGGNGEDAGECAGKSAPIAVFPAHWAPNAMTYYDKQQFPARYRNGVFIAFHGSWNRAPYAQGGYNVVFQALSGEQASGRCEIFADGFAGAEKSPAKAAHRPSGLAVGPDGALYVADDVRGRIYRIVYRGGPDVPAAAAQPVPCPSASAPAGAIATGDAKPPEGTHPDAAATRTNLPLPKGATQAMVALGERIYRGQVGGAACTGCHGVDGAGTVLGPNLTDDQWLWSDGSYAGIASTITQGVAQPKQYRAAMPPLGGAQLSSKQVSAVAAYVWGLSHSGNASMTRAMPVELLIPGEKVYPESLTATADGRVLIGSISKRQIFLVKPGAATADAWTEPDGETTLGVFGVLADDQSNTLWACFAALPGPHSTDQAPSALNAFDLRTSKLKAHYGLPTPGARCNDIAVGVDGTVYATDSANMEIDRLKNGDQQLQVWAGGGFGPKGGVIDGVSVLAHRVIVNTLATGKIFSVPIEADGTAGTVTEIKLERPLERPDGMRRFGAHSVLLVESGGVGRVSRLDIGDTGKLTTLKEGFADGPVSVAVVGTTGYVLEGQLKTLFGAPDSNSQKPFHATAIEVGRL